MMSTPTPAGRALARGALWAALALVLAAPVRAQEMTDAEVRKVDRDAGKITLKHGPVKSLDMPAMTMNYAVKDKALLEAVKPGDKVTFRAVNDNGRYLVTDIKPVR